MIPIQNQNTIKKFPIKNFGGQICLSPYTSIEIGLDGDIRLCECAAWMPTTVGNLLQNTLQQILSNELSKSIRNSIKKGTYEYCDEHTCGVIANKQLTTIDCVAPEYQECVRNPDIFLMPHIIRMAGDLTCNLSCPSCRQIVIKTSSDQIQTQENIGRIISENLFSQPSDMHITLHVSTSGEIFASPFLLKFVSSIPLQNYPRLDLQIQTNGLLAPKKWSRLGDMQHRVKKITVTTDAARQATYEKLRRGGKWEDIQKALDWISKKKSENNMQISMRMVVQRENYQEIEEFYQQAKSIGADIVEYARLTDWGTYGQDGFAQNDVFDIKHPEYSNAQYFLNKVKHYEDIFLCGGLS